MNQASSVAETKGLSLPEAFFSALERGSCILITGSGAGFGATNKKGHDFPSGGAHLAEYIYKDLGLEPHWDLKDAVDTYLDSPDRNEGGLVSLILSVLSVGKVSPSHEILYTKPWRTIYTTNYDEIPQIAAEKSGVNISPITPCQDHNKLPKGCKCVFLNGAISDLRNTRQLRTLRLSSESYSKDLDGFYGKQLYSMLKQDLASASYVVILGCSLKYDLDLERAITESSRGKNHVIFITAPATASPSREQASAIRGMKRLGEVYEIGLDGFAQQLAKHTSISGIEKNGLPYEFHCFEHFFGPDGALTEPLRQQVLSFLTFGEFSSELNYKTADGRRPYIITREAEQDIIHSLDEGKRLILLHSYFGNGKTGLIEQVKFSLAANNWHVYLFKDHYQHLLNEDIRVILNNDGERVVILDDVHNRINYLKDFKKLSTEGVRFIASTRTGLLENLALDLQINLGLLNEDCAYIDLNKLTDRELKRCDKVLAEQSFYSSGILNLTPSDRLRKLTERAKGESRKKVGIPQLNSVLYLAFESPVIKKKIDGVAQAIRNLHPGYLKAVMLALLSCAMKLDLRLSDYSSITGINLVRETSLLKNSDVKEIIDTGENGVEPKFKVHSSPLAKLLLNRTQSPQELIDVLSEAAVYAIDNRNDLRFESVLKNMVNYSLLTTFTQGLPDSAKFIELYYDRLSKLPHFKENNFFWLQYAMACIDLAEQYEEKSADYYRMAEQLLDVAYAKASKNKGEGFVPFQIDNQKARLLISRIEHNHSVDVAEDFRKATALLCKMIPLDRWDPAALLKRLVHYTDTDFVMKLESVMQIKELSAHYAKVKELAVKLVDQVDPALRKPYEHLAPNLQGILLHFVGRF
ncbi:MAG: SIR2 family protein [Succinivibrio sp.]|nr:SIR2 family protein [Succinivibrio sp.]